MNTHYFRAKASKQNLPGGTGKGRLGWLGQSFYLFLFFR